MASTEPHRLGRRFPRQASRAPRAAPRPAETAAITTAAITILTNVSAEMAVLEPAQPPPQQHQQRDAVDEHRQRRAQREPSEPHHAHERDVRGEVERDRAQADDDRHAAAPHRVEDRRHDSRRRVADEPDGVEPQRGGRGRRVGRP